MKTTRLTLVGGAILLGLSCLLLEDKFSTRIRAEKNPEPKISGRELFTREWLPGDPRSHAGDGLGPVFNARSCVACHHLGGVGGAGPRQMNVRVISAFLEEIQPQVISTWWAVAVVPMKPKQPNRSKLAGIHPALRTENSFP